VGKADNPPPHKLDATFETSVWWVLTFEKRNALNTTHTSFSRKAYKMTH